MSATDLAAHALELHRRATVIDAHCDILMAIADGKTRLGQWMSLPDPAAWEPPLGLGGDAEGEMTMFSSHTYFFGSAGQYSIPQFLAGGVTVQTCAIYIEDRHLERALQQGLEMVWWLHQEVEANDDLELVTTVADIHRVKREGICGAILSFEGFEPLGCDLRFLDLYYKLGLRMAGLTHFRRNRFGDGRQSDVQTGGLTELGTAAIKRLNELGVVIDLAHLNQVGFWEVLELSEHPMIISHRSSRKYFPLDPSVKPDSDDPIVDLSRGRERLEALASKGGVLGIIFYGQKDLEAVVADIEYVIDLVGADHVGIGSDLYGLESAPQGLEDMSKLPALTQRLVERGHSDEVILKILGGNLMRVFEQVWKD